MLRRPLRLIASSLMAAAVLAGCGQASAPGGSTPAATPARSTPATQRPPVTRAAQATWTGLTRVRGVVDLSVPRPGGAIVVAARGHLGSLLPGRTVADFAPGYAAPPGLEPYIVLSAAQRVPGAGCAFPAGTVYALRLARGNGITAVTPGGAVRRFAALPGRGLEDGIALDATGRFGHRLLVTTSIGDRTTVTTIDCRGRARVLTRSAPRVEGGLVVAPASFGRFGGDLIAPDELSGRVYAIAPGGRTALLAASGLPHGQDIGVESEGFVPRRPADALVADRHTTGNRHPGDDLILRIGAAALRRAGARPGDLLIAGEGGARTVDISCRRRCTVRPVAVGPPQAHLEGHVVFSAGP